ncbi:hypothetical protein [Clostridium tyrobutyricum]|uniref:hypothetical protein n=1 Tax=Clostridium tyrobutyricum TaxID=1519 RepID=UPI001FAB73D0|nr:hypothetical protein [Clostridium tyrobutyricum]
MHINNKAAWVETFTVAESVLSIKTGLSGRGVRNARNELKQKGRIDFRSRVGGRAPIYTIISFETGINGFNKNSSVKRVRFSNTDGNSPEQPKEMNSEEKISTEMSSAVTSGGTSAGRAGDTSVDRATLIDTDTDTDNTIIKKDNKEKEHWVTALDYFCKKSGKPDNQLRIREREAAQEVCEEIPILETVLKGIDYAFDNFKPDTSEDKINSFCYCAKVIKGLQKRENIKKNGGSKYASTGQNTESSPYDFSRFGG